MEAKNNIMKMTRLLPLLVATSSVLAISISLRASDMDDRIESSAAKSYVFKTLLKNDSIKTESKDGVVTLTGTVANANDGSMAKDTVENLPGVKSVDNQLKIGGEQPAEHSDDWISMKVKLALLFHRNVSAGDTHVYVRNGVVTLEGQASSLAEKELTTEYAKDVDHVKSVKNDMTIAQIVQIQPAPATTNADNVDDASITAEVKAELLSQRSTSDLQPKVATKDGVVTLSGIARNDAQKRLVTKQVSDIIGVASVVNNMTEDSSITVNVKTALRSERSTSALHIKVATTSGVVTLRGVAENDAEKSLATKLATDVNGVASVVNDMTVVVVAASNN
jgi:hyperosmotically inducible periplasmic protein